MGVIFGVLIFIVVLVFVVFGMIVSPILACRIVSEKGYDTSLWGVFGLFAGALAVIAAACLKDKNAPQEVVLVSEESISARKEKTKESIYKTSPLQNVMQKIVCPVCGKKFEIDRSTEETECPYCGKKLKRKK